MYGQRCPCLALWSGLLIFHGLAVFGQVPQLINYQGRLLSGSNLYNGVISLEIQLWNSPTNGALLYADSNRVEVVDGLYATMIGDNTVYGSFTNAMACSNLWIAVVVDGQPLYPRERMAAVAFAHRADGVRPGGITSGMIAPGAVTSGHLAPGAVTTVHLADRAVTTAKIAEGAVTAEALAPGAVDVDHLNLALDLVGLRLATSPVAKASTRLGTALSAFGTNAVLAGAPGGGADASGRVYLYDLQGAVVVCVTNPTLISGDEFGVSVAALGSDRFVVGAPYADAAKPDNGCAYLFGATGALVATVPSPHSEGGECFGWSVSALGTNYFVVGAPYHDDPGGDRAGTVYIFNRTGGLVRVVANPDPQRDAFFGQAVCAVGTNRFAVGAPGHSSQRGAVCLFSSEGEWLATLQNPGGDTPEQFGSSLASLGQGWLAVGAPYRSAGATNAGVVYVFDGSGAMETMIPNPAPASTDLFGSAVAALGPSLLVGTPRDDAGATDSGMVHIFDTYGTLKAAFTNPTPAAGDNFGAAVAAVGDTHFAVGAPQDDNVETDVGAVYIFRFERSLPGVVAETVKDGAITSDKIAAGAVAGPQLAKDYQAGQVAFGAEDVDFGGMLFNVPFSPPFGSVPVVSLGLETTSSTFAAGARAFVASRAATGFVAGVSVPGTTPVRVATNGGSTVTSLLTWGTNLAIAYYAGSESHLTFVRAEDPRGAKWEPESVLIDTNEGEYISMAAVSSNPAICWRRSGVCDSLMYRRSRDTLGIVWDATVPVHTNANDINYPSMAVVQGRPAIGYVVSNYVATFVRANDSTGSTWAARVLVHESPSRLAGLSMAVVNGRPAMSCWRGYHPSVDPAVIYVRASNSTGTAWGSPVIVDTNNIFSPGGLTCLAVVNGRPAIAYYCYDTEYHIRFVRALDPNGTTWGAPVGVATNEGVVGDPEPISLAVINGKPAIAYAVIVDSDTTRLRYVRALDADGTQWSEPVDVYAYDQINPGGASLAEVGGSPAVSWCGGPNTGLIFFARDNTPPFVVNWVAIEP